MWREKLVMDFEAPLDITDHVSIAGIPRGSLRDSSLSMNMFILLPVELIILIVSFLPTVLDKIRLRCACRTLRSVCDTPSLWRKFEWPIS